MASEYLKWKYRDVKPREERKLTPKEKCLNWWHYHKWHLVIGLVVLYLAADMVTDMVQQKTNVPDYQIAYVGSIQLPEDTVQALETELAALGGDINGDGRVWVQLMQYLTQNAQSQDTEQSQYAYAGTVQLMADLEAGDSVIFLLEEPEKFQVSYEVLVTPQGEAASGDALWRCWADCPVLTGLNLGSYQVEALGQAITGSSQELLSGLYIARRGYGSHNSPETLPQQVALLNAMIGEKK